MRPEETPGGPDEVTIVDDGTSLTDRIAGIVRADGGTARPVSRLDPLTMAGRVVVVAGPAPVGDVAVAVTAGAAAVLAVTVPGADIAGLLGAGARVVLPIDGLDRELPIGLAAALAGGLYVAAGLAGELRSALDLGAAASLTPRELETLRWAALGHSHREIAERMHVTEATVNTYLKRLRSKLGATDKAELTRVALRLGLV